MNYGNNNVFEEIKGLIDNDIWSLLKVFEDRICFIRDPQGEYKNLLILRPNTSSEIVLAGDILFTNFLPKVGLTTLETFERLEDDEKKALKENIFDRLRNFFETSDEMLFVLVKQQNLIDERNPYDFDKFLKRAYENSHLNEVTYLTMLIQFSENYKRNSINNLEDVALLEQDVKNRSEEHLSKEKAIQIKQKIENSKPDTYASDVNNRTHDTMMNLVIIERELETTK